MAWMGSFCKCCHVVSVQKIRHPISSHAHLQLLETDSRSYLCFAYFVTCSSTLDIQGPDRVPCCCKSGVWHRTWIEHVVTMIFLFFSNTSTSTALQETSRPQFNLFSLLHLTKFRKVEHLQLQAKKWRQTLRSDAKHCLCKSLQIFWMLQISMVCVFSFANVNCFIGCSQKRCVRASFCCKYWTMGQKQNCKNNNSILKRFWIPEKRLKWR